MKNSFLLTLFSLLTIGSVGFLTNPQQPQAKSEPIIEQKDKFKPSSFCILDSIENFKKNEITKYEFQIQKSFETLKNKEEEQKKFSVSTDSLYNMVIINNTLTKK